MGIVRLCVIVASVVVIHTQKMDFDVTTSSTDGMNFTKRWTTHEVTLNTTDKYAKAIRDTLKRFAIPTVPLPTACVNSESRSKVLNRSLLPTLLISYLSFYLMA